jgi:hypothetical protein
MNSIQDLIRTAFSETSNPDAYLPRPSTEEAIREIREWADYDEGGSSLAALVGTPGLGNTMLLRLIESRAVRPVDRPAAVYLPYAGLGPEDLCYWAYGLLGKPLGAGEVETAEAAVDRLVELGQPTNPFFLLLDDADSMPVETITALVECLPRHHSPLRLLIAVNPDAKASRLLGQLGALTPRTISYRTRLTDHEAGEYLRGRMKWAGFPPVEIQSLEPIDIVRMNGLSAGVPRKLHSLASAHFASRDAGYPSELTTKYRREEWMGQPFDDDLDASPIAPSGSEYNEGLERQDRSAGRKQSQH